MGANKNYAHELLPKLTRSIWRTPMREVDGYLRNIDHFFRLNELKIEEKQYRINVSEILGGDAAQAEEWMLKVDRLNHDSRYNLFIKSSAVMICSVFEKTLAVVVKTVQEVTGVKVDVRAYKKKSGNNYFSGYIGQSLCYLVEFHNMEWSGLEGMWKRIDNFRFVRNQIVHDGGELDENKSKRFDRIATEESGLSRDEEMMQLDLFYLTQIVGVMKDFLEELCKRLDGRVFIK